MATTYPPTPGTAGEPEDPGVPDDVLRRERLRARVYRLSELLTTPTEQARPLLGDFLRVGEVTILGGHGGQGKSTMSLEMVHAVTTGGEFLGAECSVGRAIVVDLEQGIGVAQRAVMKTFFPRGFDDGVPVSEQVQGMDFGPYAEHVRWCDWREGAGPDGWDEMFEVIEELLEEEPTDLVLLDPVYKLMLGRNSNEAEIVGQLVACIDSIRSRHPDVAWLIPMHPRKPPAGGGGGMRMHDLFGAAMWSWWASAVFMLWRTGGRGATLRVEKDRLGRMMLEDWTVFLNEEGYYERIAGEAEDAANERSDLTIWKLFQEVPGKLYTRETIEQMTGIPKATVTKATQKMARRKAMGTGYRELVVEPGKGTRKLYGFMPTPPDPVVDALKDEFDATEED